MRSGSSWLHYNLKRHPQIFMPHIKELHYFDKQKDGVYIQDLARKHLNFVVKHHTKKRHISLADLQWYFNYFLFPRNDGWYVRNFQATAGKRVVGEVTPVYSILDATKIEEIGRKWPHLKILFLIRNPIDRAWSHVTKSLARSSNTNIADIDEDRIRVRLADQNVLCRGDYTTILDKWSSVYGRERIFVGFYEQIANDPQGLMQGICEFLGVDYDDDFFRDEHLKSRVNNTSRFKSEILIEFRKYLADYYFDVICEMNRRFGSYATLWEEQARALR
jgi:hypothetical protein